MTDLRGWRSCPRCGGPVEVEKEAARCPACGYAAYANPAPAACAFVLDDRGCVLLGRRRAEPYAGMWDAIGGFLHEGEDALEALKRELLEETGCEIEPLAFVGAFADRYGEEGGATINLYWSARLRSGEPRPADDVSELAWFELDALPELAFANVARALEALREQLREGAGPLGMFEVQLVTGDLDALEAFYRDVLGLDVSLRDADRGRVHFRLRRGQLILARADGEPEAARAWPGLPPPLVARGDERGPTPPAHGPIHFAIELRAASVVAEGERLRRAGHDVRGPFRWPRGQLSVYLRDPDGNVVELIGVPAA